jgi:hypothetical protein
LTSGSLLVSDPLPDAVPPAEFADEDAVASLLAHPARAMLPRASAAIAYRVTRDSRRTAFIRSSLS